MTRQKVDPISDNSRKLSEQQPKQQDFLGWKSLNYHEEFVNEEFVNV